MTARQRRRLTGLLYVAPAVIFVLVFTAVPLIGMVAMSLALLPRPSRTLTRIEDPALADVTA